MVVVTCLALSGGASAVLAGEPRPPTEGQSGPAADIAATVDGIPIYRREIEAHVNREIPRGSFHRRVSEAKRDKLRREALEMLLVEILAAREGERRGVEVTAGIEQEIQEMRRKLRSRRRQVTDLETALRRAGRTLAGFRAEIRRRILAEAVEKADVTDKVKVSDAKVRQYFEKNRALYERPEAVRVKHFLLKVKPWVSAKEREAVRLKAETIRAGIVGGGSFEEAAKRHTGAAPKGLEAGVGLTHRGGLIRAIEDAVFATEPGKLAPVLKSIYGFHIVQVLEKRPPEQLAFEDVMKAVRKQVEKDERQRLRTEWVAGLCKDVKVEVLWKRLLPAETRDSADQKVRKDASEEAVQ
jgi:peptidyl-prolyl cis-trans isomerase C